MKLYGCSDKKWEYVDANGRKTFDVELPFEDYEYRKKSKYGTQRFTEYEARNNLLSARITDESGRLLQIVVFDRADLPNLKKTMERWHKCPVEVESVNHIRSYLLFTTFYEVIEK